MCEKMILWRCLCHLRTSDTVIIMRHTRFSETLTACVSYRYVLSFAYCWKKRFCNVHLKIKQDFVMCGCWQDYVSGNLHMTLTSYKSSPNRAAGGYFMQML